MRRSAAELLLAKRWAIALDRVWFPYFSEVGQHYGCISGVFIFRFNLL